MDQDEDICRLIIEIEDKWELIDRIKGALKSGANLNQLCEYDEVPIHTCAQLGDEYLPVTMFLYDNGADLNIKYDNEIGEPVFFSVLYDIMLGQYPSEMTLKFLIQKSDINMLSNEGKNIFSNLYEIFFERPYEPKNYLLETLIQNGADPHQVVTFSPYGQPAEDGIDMSFVEYLNRETNGHYRNRAREILNIINYSSGGRATKSARK